MAQTTEVLFQCRIFTLITVFPLISAGPQISVALISVTPLGIHIEISASL